MRRFRDYHNASRVHRSTAKGGLARIMVIVLGKKARLAIVAALHDVQGNTIEVDTRSAGHGMGRIIVVYPND